MVAIKALREPPRIPAFSSFAYNRLVNGYHGCDRQVRERILAGGAFLPASNPWDWLGDGAYFWEYGPDRAYRWAADHPGIDDPAVLGAVIQLGQCFDLLDTRFTTQLRVFHAKWERMMHVRDLDLPENRGKARYLDRAVIEAFMTRAEELDTPYDTVRAAFVEGNPVYPGSGFNLETHIQIAVRNPESIVGVFQPVPVPSGESDES